MPTNVFTDYIPENTSGKRSLNSLPGIPGASIIRFPESLGKEDRNSIPFTIFMPYKRAKALDGFYSVARDNLFAGLPPPSFAIVLPTPTSALKTQYQAMYSPLELSQAVGGAMLGGSQGIRDAMEKASTGDITGAAIDAATALGQGAGAALTAFGKQYIGGLLPNKVGVSEEALNIALGAADNPFTENMFRNVEFREHTFAYTLMPRNKEDSIKIDKIITLFKYGMLPAHGALGAENLMAGFLEFPYEFQITHSIQDTTFTLLPSVLTSLEVDYSGGTDSPKLFKADKEGAQYPAKITLTMMFREMVLLTRQKVMYDTIYGDDGAPTPGKRFRF